MSAKQKAKHNEEHIVKILTPEVSELTPAEPTPDGLGEWQGGITALKGAPNWVGLKSRASRTASAKNTPGTDYASKINETHQKVTDVATPTA
jgi:hypothetical protein